MTEVLKTKEIIKITITVLIGIAVVLIVGFCGWYVGSAQPLLGMGIHYGILFGLAVIGMALAIFGLCYGASHC